MQTHKAGEPWVGTVALFPELRELFVTAVAQCCSFCGFGAQGF